PRQAADAGRAQEARDQSREAEEGGEVVAAGAAAGSSPPPAGASIGLARLTDTLRLISGLTSASSLGTKRISVFTSTDSMVRSLVSSRCRSILSSQLRSSVATMRNTSFLVPCACETRKLATSLGREKSLTSLRTPSSVVNTAPRPA